jgi:RNA polymerase sigma factor (sigma-70 family)
MGDDSPTDGELRDQRHLAGLKAARDAGDPVAERRAMGTLLDPYWSHCRTIARGRIGGVPNPLSDSEDIAQEVMRRVAIALAKKTDFDSPFHVVVNANLAWAVGDYWRKDARQQAVPADPVDLPGHLVEDGPSKFAEGEDFDRHLTGLSDRDQELMRERILADMSPAEIAAARGMTEGAVNTSLHRAFQKLRDNLRTDVRNSTGGAD